MLWSLHQQPPSTQLQFFCVSVISSFPRCPCQVPGAYLTLRQSSPQSKSWAYRCDSPHPVRNYIQQIFISQLPCSRKTIRKETNVGGGRIVGASGVKDTTRNPTEPTNLGSQELTETEPPAREPAWD